MHYLYNLIIKFFKISFIAFKQCINKLFPLEWAEETHAASNFKNA